MTVKRTMKIDYDDLPRIEKFPLFHDERGFFSPIKLQNSWSQSNFSYNKMPLVFRGVHYQEGSYAQSKTIQVFAGKILDFIIDIRPESVNFGEVENFYMEVGDIISIPRGYAHAFLTLEPDTIVQYFVDNIYSPQHEGAITWDSIENIESQVLLAAEEIGSNIIINQKDRDAETWEDYKQRVLKD
jgi:dTDP-4-dehydrorhamnose 3,5-epimerase